jgi:hypothetical protein
VSSKQQDLKIGRKAKRRDLVEKTVAALDLLALLPSGQNGLAAIFAQKDSAAVPPFEIVSLNLFAVQQGQRQPVGESRSQFLHQIEGEAGPPRPVAVQESDSPIKTDGLARATAFVRQQHIKKGQQRIDGVERRSARPAMKAQALIV